MDDIEVRVLATKLESLTDRIDQGFGDLKDLIKGGKTELGEHIKEYKQTNSDFGEEIEALKIDMARFKERWLLIGGIISLFSSVIVHFIGNAFK